MKNLYNSNGLIFWSSREIKLRRMFESLFVDTIFDNLKTQNRGFEIEQIEAPMITPAQFINPNYTAEDIFVLSEDFSLRPETTMGSYQALAFLLDTHNERKYKLPLVVWQHGKSFRREQDQPTKFMRLKEFYQLELQIAYSSSTMNDYSEKLVPELVESMTSMLGPCHVEESDRLPSYSEKTLDIVCDKTSMEICSISKRKDFPGAKILEVAIGTDRCVFNFLNK